MKSFIKQNILYFYIGLFLIISYLSILNTTIYLSPSIGNIYYKQIIWYSIGLLLIYIIKRINIKTLYKISPYVYVINLILLFGLFFFGSEINNSKAWYNILGISFQPSEFMKISILLLDTYLIEKFKKEENKLIIGLFIILLIPSILTFLQPDTGAVIGYFVITFSLLFISDINKKWIKRILLLIIIIITSFLFIYFNYQEMFISLFGSSFFYRIDRLINWQAKSGIQLNNSLIAIGSSGIFGHNHIPIYYPELETDFIFTSFTTSFGIVGGLTLIILLFSFDLYILNLIKKEPSKQNKYLLFGILFLFLYQHIQSIGMTLGLLPITGITLPLISYGGSSVLSNLILIGIIMSMQNKKNRFL